MPDNSAIPEGFELEAPAAPAAPLPEPEPDQNRARYIPIALRAADSFGVPRALFLWQIGQESNWNPNARNPAPGTHATGIAQFQPGTAKQFALDPLNPEDSLYAAARYMRELHDKTGDWGSALKHYGTVGDDSPASVKRAAESVTPEVPEGFQVESAIPEGFEVEKPAARQLAAAQPASAQYGIKPAQATFADRVRQFLFGGPEGETALGRAFPSLAGGKISDTPTVDLPTVRFEQPLAPGANPAVYVAHGVNQFATGLTTPKNLAIMAATGGLGAIIPAAGYASVAGKLINTALSAYFADQMVKGASDAMQAAYTAHQQGNNNEAARLLGYGGLAGLMAGAAGFHAASSGEGVLSTQVPRPAARALTPEVVPPEATPEAEPIAAAPPPTVNVQAEPPPEAAKPAETAPPADVPPGVPPSVPAETAKPAETAPIPTGFQVESQPEAAPPLSTQLPAQAETGKADENKSPDWFKPGQANPAEPIRKEGDQTTVSVVRWQRTPGTPEVNPQGATFFSVANQAGQDSHSTYAGKEPAAIHWGGEHQVAGDISFSNPLELPTEKQGKYNLPLPEQIIQKLAGPAAADFDRHYSMETQFQKFGVARGRAFLDQEAELESRLGIPPGTIADARSGPPGQIANSVAIALLRRDGYDGAIGRPQHDQDLAEAVRLTPLAPHAQDDALPQAAHQAPAVEEEAPTTPTGSPAEPPAGSPTLQNPPEEKTPAPHTMFPPVDNHILFSGTASDAAALHYQLDRAKIKWGYEITDRPGRENVYTLKVRHAADVPRALEILHEFLAEPEPQPPEEETPAKKPLSKREQAAEDKRAGQAKARAAFSAHMLEVFRSADTSSVSDDDYNVMREMVERYKKQGFERMGATTLEYFGLPSAYRGRLRSQDYNHLAIAKLVRAGYLIPEQDESADGFIDFRMGTPHPVKFGETPPGEKAPASSKIDSSRERPVAYGHPVEVAVPGEPKRYPAKYALREAGDVEPSHNPQSFEPNANYEHRNDRDYSRAINGARPVEYSSPGTFDTGYVVKESHTAEHGHTVTDNRRNALGGNARLLTQLRVYARGGADADKLKAETIRAATTYGGISPEEAAKFEHPLLTREVEGDLSRSEAQNAITDFNKTGAASLTPAEQSLSDSRRVSPDTLDYLSFQIAEQGEDGTLAQVLSGSKGPAIIERLIADGVITANQRGKYITEKGVTAEGKQRITQLMVGRLFDSPAEFDATAPELRNKLEKIVGPLARVEVNPEWSLTEQTREAVGILNDARQHGIKNLDDLERQDTIFDKDLSDDPLAIARLIHAGQVKAAAAFRQYAADFEVFQRAEEGHAFDFLTPPTPREAFESAFFEKPAAEPLLSRELVRVAPDREKKYTPDELYRDVDSEPLPATATRPARLRVNWQAGRFIAIAMRSGHFSGALIPAGHMNFVARRVHDLAKQFWAGEAIELETFQRLENLADSLFEVAKLAQGNPAIIYRSDFGDYPIPGMPVAGVMGAIRMRAETMREELTHQQQHVFARGEIGTEHLTLAMRDYVMKDPAWPQIYKMLHDPGQGYEKFSHEQIILEAAAKIAAGRAESELNLTPRDAIRWLKRYEQGLIETHGLVPAGEVFRFADPDIKSKLELAHAEDPHARERGDRAPESGPRNGRNQDGETGPAAEPGAPARKSRAADEAARRRGGARDDEGLRSLGGEDLSLFGDDENQEVAETAARDRDQLQGQRLTAQLNAPLTRDEQLKKLKRTKEDPAAGEQSDFFEAPPEKPQGSLFSKSKDEGVTLGAGLGALDPYLRRFLKGDVVPTLKQLAELTRLYKGDLLKLLAPAAVEGAEPMALSVRHRAAELARATDVAHATLKAAGKYFDTRPEQENFDFIDRVETGAKQPTPELQAIHDILRPMLDGRRDAIRALGTGKLQKAIENYFPHLYKDPKQAQAVFENAGKRPLEGSKSFLKKRTIATFKDAIAQGLEPFSSNPVDLVLAKVREMDKYLAAHRIFADAKERGQLVAIDARDGQAPNGWKKIDDPMATIYGPSIQQINEYPNEGLHTGLDTVANALGLKQERGFLNLHGAVGRANQRTGTVKTLHGTAEDVLAHEIGHQIDWLAGSGKRFVEQYPDAQSAARLKRAYKTLKPGSGSTLADRQAARKELKDLAPQIQQRKAFAKELRDLADLRGGRKEYIRKREEKMAQLAQMWVGAREQFERTAPTVFKEWKRFLDENPKLHALRDIEGSVELKGLSQPYDVGGLVIRAHWWAPDAAARILNNYLSPGLRDKSAIVRSFLSVSNFMNQAQLGFSGFHAAFTLTEAATSHLALAIYQGVNGILDGDARSVAQSFRTAAFSPLAPFTSLMRGHQMLQEWNRPGSQSALIGQLADAAVIAGGRAKQESFYQTHITERMMKAWREGNIFGAAWRAPFAAFEVPTRLIMEGLVPRLKMGAFADMAEHELARLGPNAAVMDVERALAKVWDSVDNRFGQLVYDDLFWHKYTKDLAMMLVRSPGWNVGDIRELGGGYADSAKFLKNSGEDVRMVLKGGTWKAGRRGRFTHRMAYIPAHLIVAMTLAGLATYIYHKRAPRDLKEWFFFTDSHGQRWSLPTYVKDEFHYYTDPIGTAIAKLNPILPLAKAILTNKDYWDRKIVHAHHWPAELKQFAEYVLEQYEPLWMQQNHHALHRQTTADKILPELGITHAPKALDKHGSSSGSVHLHR